MWVCDLSLNVALYELGQPVTDLKFDKCLVMFDVNSLRIHIGGEN